MKRTTGAVAIASAAALLLSACGESETPAEQTPADTQDAAADTAEDSAAGTEEAPGDAASETAMSDGTNLVIWSDDLRAAALEEHAKAFEEETGVPVVIQVVANENLREQF